MTKKQPSKQAEYEARRKQSIIQAGGAQLSVMLSPQAWRALQLLAAKAGSIRKAIEQALAK